ncbi:HAD family hydrolase [Methanocaldococcus indicus]|uniref:HAD family hydrolase n=1 Tax=Methanocaldococcus indicus TaxID=213231 RepID=UPI003C6D7F1F
MILLLDLNGTIALDGEIIEGVKERLEKLKKKFDIYILSADTFGTLEDIGKKLGVSYKKVDKLKYGSEGIAKLMILLELKKNNNYIVAIGNGKNDKYILEKADLGICVIGKEGANINAILSADVVVNNILDALDLLIYEKRLKATMRD